MADKKEQLSRRKFVKVALYSASGVIVGSLSAWGYGDPPPLKSNEDLKHYYWGFVIDTTRCIGCGSCVRACKVENDVPDEYFRTWVERYEIDADDKVYVDSPDGSLHSFKPRRDTKDKEIKKAFFVPKMCNHCIASACTQVCPVGATFHTPDGVVVIDKDHCVGCAYCVQACPYGCRYIDHRKGTADKCTYCYHRIHRGLTTACVTVCPRKARVIGNLKDPNSPVRKVIESRRYSILKPDMGTRPKCYYIGLDLEVK